MDRPAAHAPLSQPFFVAVIEDDEDVRVLLDDLLHTAGLDVQLFGSTAEFLEWPLPDTSGCIVLDVQLPDASGVEFQQELSRLGVKVPVVMITGHADVPTTVRAMKAGAVDFLSKPFRNQEMLDAVEMAIARDVKRRSEEVLHEDLKALHTALTPREQTIMVQVTAGMKNKVIAANLGLSEITIKIHRASLMRKMKAQSLAELVRQAQMLGICNDG
uniref:response regulator transcription factor n=1 Tax=Methylobacterium sp. B34 TaxID=95563 RepID=UPI0005B272EC|nr:response regulator [Methylobacterium sp. B34]